MMVSIFWDGFFHRLYPPHAELLLGALAHFQPENHSIMWPWAAVGGWVASLFLYALGITLRRFPARISTPHQQARIEALRPHALHFLPWGLLLVSTPMGGIMLLAAGFFALRLWKTLLPVMVGDILFRLFW